MASKTPEQISAKVQESLKDGPYACISLIALSGGTANFIYRGELLKALEDGSRTVVIKHTEGFVASNPNFKITATRCVRPLLSAANLRLIVYLGLRANHPGCSPRLLASFHLGSDSPNTSNVQVLPRIGYTNLFRPPLVFGSEDLRPEAPSHASSMFSNRPCTRTLDQEIPFLGRCS